MSRLSDAEIDKWFDELACVPWREHGPTNFMRRIQSQAKSHAAVAEVVEVVEPLKPWDKLEYPAGGDIYVPERKYNEIVSALTHATLERELESLRAGVVEEIIERCAKVCDAMEARWDGEEFYERGVAAQNLAVDIRALKDSK